MAKSYTPSNLKTVKFQVTGLDEYLKKIAQVGKNVDEAVERAITESSPIILKEIKAWAQKHKLTGETLEGVTISNVQRSGSYIFVEIGINTEQAQNAWHAVFVEYGSPTQPADPGIRNAFLDNRLRVIKIQKKVLAEEGIPIE